MNIINKPLPAGSTTNAPELIVVHAMAEYLKMKEGDTHASDFLNNIGLSVHALICPNGDVMMCRAENTGAYHARGFNKNSLGVEFLVEGAHDYGTFIEAIKTDYVTKGQYESGVELMRLWIGNHDIGKLKRHSDISPERKVDPGAGFRWESFLNDIGISI